MGKEIINQVLEAQRVPYRINPRRNTPRHILIKLSLEINNVKIFHRRYRMRRQTTMSSSSLEYFGITFYLQIINMLIRKLLY